MLLLRRCEILASNVQNKVSFLNKRFSGFTAVTTKNTLIAVYNEKCRCLRKNCHFSWTETEVFQALYYMLLETKSRPKKGPLKPNLEVQVKNPWSVARIIKFLCFARPLFAGQGRTAFVRVPRSVESFLLARRR